MTKHALTDNATFMGIDDADLAHIFGLLRRHTYSMPQLVIPQELMCNGRDSHREAGTAGKPIDVYLPDCDDGEPKLIVRDYGTGMSEETIRDVYTKYGKSTKRGQDKTTGMFGIGAKSPWALEYCEEFFVDSFYNGTLSNYRLFIDDSGVGALECLNKADTKEPNGVCVTVGISHKDVELINENFKRITNFWGVKPNVVNDQNFKWDSITDNIRLETDEWILYESGLGCGIEDGPVAILDDIPYAIAIESLNLSSEIEKAFLNNSVFFMCDRGSIAPAANREQLQYNEATIKTLSTIITKAVTEFKSGFKA